MNLDPLLIAAALALLYGKKKDKGEPVKVPKPEIPREILDKVADIVAVRLTAGTNVPSMRVIDEIKKLLRDNPNLTAKLIMVYQSELQGESDDAQQQ